MGCQDKQCPHHIKMVWDIGMSEKMLNFAVENATTIIVKGDKGKDAGVVERDGLENRCTLTGTQGSNPCLSAT